MSKYLKIKKKSWNLIGSKPEHHNLRRKTTIKTKFEFSRKKEHSLIADTKLQNDQVREKWRQSSISHFYFKIKYFESQNDHRLSSNQLDNIILSWLGGQQELSLVSYDLKCSVI